MQACAPLSSSHKWQKLKLGRHRLLRDLPSYYIAGKLKGASNREERKPLSQPRNWTDKKREACNVYLKLLLPSEPMPASRWRSDRPCQRGSSPVGQIPLDRLGSATWPNPVPTATQQGTPESYHKMRPVLEIRSFLLRWLRLRWKCQQTALHIRIIHDTDSLRESLNTHTSIYTRSTTFVSKLSKKSKLLSLRKKKNPSEPVMKHTSSSFWALDSTHIWLCLGAKFSRSLQGQQMTPNKNSLGNLSRSRKGNKTAWAIHSKWQLWNPNSHFFVPIWSQCAEQAQSKLSFSEGL